jgi:hypothetical protein
VELVEHHREQLPTQTTPHTRIYTRLVIIPFRCTPIGMC